MLDSGSTHNFLNIDVAKRLGLKSAGEENCQVLTVKSFKAWGAAMVSIFGFKEFPFLRFLSAAAGSWEAVLEAQWLRMLGPILWDFGMLLMRFTICGRKVELHGLAAPGARSTGRRQSHLEDDETHKTGRFARLLILAGPDVKNRTNPRMLILNKVHTYKTKDFCRSSTSAVHVRDTVSTEPILKVLK